MTAPRIPANATRRPYTWQDCCCGDPNCTDFEDRMAALGIPLDEIEVVEFTVPLTPCGCTPTQECDRHYLDADDQFRRRVSDV